MRAFGFVGTDRIAVSGGLNAKLNEMHAAMALASLDDLQDQVKRNRERYYTYRASLDAIPGIRLLEFDERYQTGYKNIVVELLDDWPLSREHTIKILNAENILARAYYYPALHRKQMDFPFVPAHLPVTDDLAERYLNLPCGQLVTNKDIVDIVNFLHFIYSNAESISERLYKVEAA